jgi:hypothetical protein
VVPIPIERRRSEEMNILPVGEEKTHCCTTLIQAEGRHYYLIL